MIGLTMNMRERSIVSLCFENTQYFSLDICQDNFDKIKPRVPNLQNIISCALAIVHFVHDFSPRGNVHWVSVQFSLLFTKLQFELHFSSF